MARAGVGDLGRGVEHLRDPTRRRRRPRRLRDQLAREPERHDEHEDVGVERDELPDFDVAVDREMTAVPEDGDERERGEQVEERDEARAQPRRRERAVEHGVGPPFQPARLAALDAEALHHADAGDALLDHARQLTELVLEREGLRAHLVREADRERGEDRQRAEREERERAGSRAP